MNTPEPSTLHNSGSAENATSGHGYTIGDLVQVTCEAPAHGGALIARTQAGVVFVRHGVIGEEAQVKITAVGPKQRYYFGDVVTVKNPAPTRRVHPWAQADALKTPEERQKLTGTPDLLGGMEYGHLEPAEQRRYKAEIVRTQLHRLGGIPLESPLLTNLIVESMPNRDLVEGDLSWRSRIRYTTAKSIEDGKIFWRIGMYPYRGAHPVPVIDFPLMARELRDLDLHKLNLRGVRELEATLSSRGRILLQFVVDPQAEAAHVAKDLEQQCTELWGELAKRKISLFFTPYSSSNTKPGRRSVQPSVHSPYRRVRQGDVLLGGGLRSVTEEVSFGSRRFSYQVSAGGFWQIHRCAPSVLMGTMLTMLRPTLGECALDLYAGAGLFTAALADAVGAEGTVVSIEGSPVTHRDARSNFAPDGPSRSDNSQETRVEVIRGDVAQSLQDLNEARALNQVPAPDAVVLDPSREGANRKVLERLNNLKPGRILYVACDPAALGRDTAILRELGWDLVQVRAFDMYPNTHHVEVLALFHRAPARIRPVRLSKRQK